MTCQSRIVALSAALLVASISGSAAADAPPPAATAPPAAAGGEPVKPPSGSRPLQPFEVDIRGTASTDILLIYVGLGANADLCLVPAGPGTSAVGAGFEYDFCGSVCWFFSAVTPFSFGQYQIAPSVRASYHIDLKKKNLDLYPLIFGGPVFARAHIDFDDGSASYVATDTGFQIGAGAGLNYFVTERVFIGLEARFRYAKGTYSYELRSGNDRVFDKGNGDSWSLTGLNLMFAAGVRL
ncbi:hypothetical protein BH11MYX4_BH11MYX4_15090 [soil metagenome]